MTVVADHVGADIEAGDEGLELDGARPESVHLGLVEVVPGAELAHDRANAADRLEDDPGMAPAELAEA